MSQLRHFNTLLIIGGEMSLNGELVIKYNDLNNMYINARRYYEYISPALEKQQIY